MAAGGSQLKMKPATTIPFFVLFVFQLVPESLETSIADDRYSRQNGEDKAVKMIPIRPQKKKPLMFKYTWNDPDVQTVHTYAALPATLNCSVKGRLKPEVTWLRSDQPIRNRDERM